MQSYTHILCILATAEKECGFNVCTLPPLLSSDKDENLKGVIDSSRACLVTIVDPGKSTHPVPATI